MTSVCYPSKTTGKDLLETKVAIGDKQLPQNNSVGRVYLGEGDTPPCSYLVVCDSVWYLDLSFPCGQTHGHTDMHTHTSITDTS